MKKIIFMLLFSLVILLMTDCKSDKPADEQVQSELQSGDELLETRQKEKGKTVIWHVDNEKSYLTWKGNKPGGSHNGKLRVNFGRMAADNANIHGIEITFDMASLEVEDLSGDQKTKLESDLKGPNFFNVEKYPFAEFTVTQVQPFDGSEGYNFTVRGPLRIKDVTKDITIPIKATFSNERVIVDSPTFTLNRTDWGINYRSGLINTAKDMLINDELELSVHMELFPRDK